MKCLICGESKWFTHFQYDEPDKYEQWQKIEDVNRSWLKCARCGFFRQIRNYDIKELEGIYKNGYRDPEFRGETVKQAFHRINSYEYGESENQQRAIWFGMMCRFSSLLDIGSGLGVFPNFVTRWDVKATCVEKNEFSMDFIKNDLGLKCFESVEEVKGEFGAVSIIHVLEHVEDPVGFLIALKPNIDASGSLLVEVPDSSEFADLPQDHDEFNSCHCYFYDMASLYTVLKRSGYAVKDMHREYYPQRKLTRIMAIAKCN